MKILKFLIDSKEDLIKHGYETFRSKFFRQIESFVLDDGEKEGGEGDDDGAKDGAKDGENSLNANSSFSSVNGTNNNSKISKYSTNSNNSKTIKLPTQNLPKKFR